MTSLHYILVFGVWTVRVGPDRQCWGQLIRREIIFAVF